MLGHTFLQSWEKSHIVKCTLRKEIQSYNNANYFNEDNSIENIDVLDESKLEKVIEDFMPDVLVNCVGVTKQIINDSKIMHSIYINSYLPHALKAICEKHKIRLILMFFEIYQHETFQLLLKFQTNQLFLQNLLL